ncbi:vacuolar ATP synthase subunit D [Aspergillus fumigatus]|nr:vacuolar ATP synthase subunit D [Aspergillus fumigatus]
MSGAVGREPVFPTRQSLGLMKKITRRIDEAKQKMGRVMQIAAFSLAEVSYAVGGDIGYQVQESAKQARFRVRAKQENVSGVFLPQFESYTEEGINDFGLTGLGKGGQQVQRCRETYARAVETLVELANEVIKVVNRRVSTSLSLEPRTLSNRSSTD